MKDIAFLKSTNILGALELAIMELKVLKMGNNRKLTLYGIIFAESAKTAKIVIICKFEAMK